MVRKAKYSLLAAAVVAGAVGGQSAQAAFVYDLRFAPGQGQSDAHTLSLLSVGTPITLQLWGQITGNASNADDGWTHGFLGIASTQVGGGAFSGGGLSNGQVDGVNFSAANSANGLASNLTNDGIGDWGATATATASSTAGGWLLWQAQVASPPGFQPNGNAVAGHSQALAGGGWEVLLATFTLTPGGVAGTGSTKFDVVSGLTGNVKTGSVSTAAALISTVDNAVAGTAITSGGITIVGGGGVVTPEPASLSMLALGGLALLVRRRK